MLVPYVKPCIARVACIAVLENWFGLHPNFNAYIFGVIGLICNVSNTPLCQIFFFKAKEVIPWGRVPIILVTFVCKPNSFSRTLNRLFPQNDSQHSTVLHANHREKNKINH